MNIQKKFLSFALKSEQKWNLMSPSIMILRRQSECDNTFYVLILLTINHSNSHYSSQISKERNVAFVQDEIDLILNISTRTRTRTNIRKTGKIWKQWKQQVSLMCRKMTMNIAMKSFFISLNILNKMLSISPKM